MTPKEKAREIFGKMYYVDDINGNQCMVLNMAKQCALIAVEEVINSMTVATSVYLPFWQEVKQEIEKL